MNDGSSLTEALVDGFVAIILFLCLATAVALAGAFVSAIGLIVGLSHELSITVSLFAISGILLLSAGLAVLASIELQHFSAD